jgi:hypothetical protein
MHSTYKEKFCSRFDLKQPDGDLIKVFAEKKSRTIIQYLGLAPTDDDLKFGKIFKVERDQCTISSAFISTKQGGLIGAVEIIETDPQQYGFANSSSCLSDWVCRKVCDHHKTAEDIKQEEDFKRRREEAWAKSAEWEKKNTELRDAEYTELREQVKHSALPDTVVDQLVTLAVRDTDEQRKNSPDRRPTFAPPIPFSKELIDALERFKALDSKTQFEPGYGRLWAVWESPKKTHGQCARWLIDRQYPGRESAADVYRTRVDHSSPALARMDAGSPGCHPGKDLPCRKRALHPALQTPRIRHG